MTDRGRAKKIGDGGEALVLSMIQTRGDWIARPQHHDIGVDIEAELDDPEALGQFLKIQVKGTLDPRPADGEDKVSVTKTFLRYAQECALPVILVRVWISERRASYIWIQEWLDENTAGLDLTAGPSTAQVTVTRDFECDLGSVLKDIARRATARQFRAGLRDVARWAVMHRSVPAVRQLSSLLVEMGHQSDAPVSTMIEELISFSLADLEPGQIRGAWEFHAEMIPMLMAICKTFPTQFSKEDVLRLVLRADSYSRAALHGLGAMYDIAPAHMATLMLPATFEVRELYELAFYCRLRELHPGVSALNLAYGVRPLEAPGGRVRTGGRFETTYPNRGDSTFLDFYEPDEDTLRKLGWTGATS